MKNNANLARHISRTSAALAHRMRMALARGAAWRRALCRAHAA
jgi:hypothetical protein